VIDSNFYGGKTHFFLLLKKILAIKNPPLHHHILFFSSIYSLKSLIAVEFNPWNLSVQLFYWRYTGKIQITMNEMSMENKEHQV